MSAIGSALQSAFTPSGTNALQGQEATQAGLTGDYAALLKQMFPTLQQEQNYSDSLVPTQEADMNRMLMLASPGNDQARAQLYNNAAYSNAAHASKQADQADAAAGLSPALEAGQNQGITNAAAASANQYQQMLNSPTYQLQQAQNLMGQLNQAQQLPGMGELGALTQGIYGAPTVQVQPGLGSFLGELGGSYLGGLGKSEGGGGNNGGNDGNGMNFNFNTTSQSPVPLGPPAPAGFSGGGGGGSDPLGGYLPFGTGIGPYGYGGMPSMGGGASAPTPPSSDDGKDGGDGDE